MAIVSLSPRKKLVDTYPCFGAQLLTHKAVLNLFLGRTCRLPFLYLGPGIALALALCFLFDTRGLNHPLKLLGDFCHAFHITFVLVKVTIVGFLPLWLQLSRFFLRHETNLAPFFLDGFDLLGFTALQIVRQGADRQGGANVLLLRSNTCDIMG